MDKNIISINHFTGEGQNLRTRREVLPVADNFLLLHTEVPFIDYFSHFPTTILL